MGGGRFGRGVCGGWRVFGLCLRRVVFGLHDRGNSQGLMSFDALLLNI